MLDTARAPPIIGVTVDDMNSRRPGLALRAILKTLPKMLSFRPEHCIPVCNTELKFQRGKRNEKERCTLVG